MNSKQNTIQYKRDHHIGRLFQIVYKSFNSLAVQKLAELGYVGITPFQAEVISHIEVGGSRQQDVISSMGVSKQAVGEAVKYLKEAGYIMKQRDPDDKRAHRLSFTSKGISFLSAAESVKQEIEKEYSLFLGADEFEKLKESLQKLIV